MLKRHPLLLHMIETFLKFLCLLHLKLLLKYFLLSPSQHISGAYSVESKNKFLVCIISLFINENCVSKSIT